MAKTPTLERLPILEVDFNRPGTLLLVAGVGLGLFLAGAITAVLNTRKRERAAEARGYQRARAHLQAALAQAAASDPATLARLAQQDRAASTQPGGNGAPTTKPGQPCADRPDKIPGVDDTPGDRAEVTR